MSLRNFSNTTHKKGTDSRRDFHDDIEAQLHTTKHNKQDFNDSKEAEQMAADYMAYCLESSVKQASPDKVEITKDDLNKVIDSLRMLRRFYYQKIIPYSTILRLEELIKRLEKER
ncbi:MAG: hypothetical protein FWE45_02865 [Firmicutes bacterium]|nr:hypothetical protein [Bacillota bacterium]